MLHALNGFFARHDGIEDPVVAYVSASQVLFAALLVVLFVGDRGLAGRAARRGAVAAGVSAALALVIAQVVSHLVDRSRPFASDPSGVHLFSAHGADPGFPSDHATAAFAIAIAILLRSRRWGLLAVTMATILAVARVAMGVHYPSDVIAGAALGSATALALWWAPIRGPLHAIADRAGAALEALVDVVADRVRPAGRA
ncbi:MAG: phosphatase PAP2 family protein [Solirubrobacterales bacterium]|nr:phosphatase PAP2 family protein [Solirubrobacterales bacterium]